MKPMMERRIRRSRSGRRRVRVVDIFLGGGWGFFSWASGAVVGVVRCSLLVIAGLGGLLAVSCGGWVCLLSDFRSVGVRRDLD